jgi:hypothetical protein
VAWSSATGGTKMTVPCAVHLRRIAR